MSTVNEKIRDLASLLAESIRRQGAAYGSLDDWRRDITAAVKIMEEANIGIDIERRHLDPGLADDYQEFLLDKKY